MSSQVGPSIESAKGPATYHRLPKILEQEAERTRRVRHCVSAVQDNEGVIEVVVQLNLGSDAYPVWKLMSVYASVLANFPI